MMLSQRQTILTKSMLFSPFLISGELELLDLVNMGIAIQTRPVLLGMQSLRAVFGAGTSCQNVSVLMEIRSKVSGEAHFELFLILFLLLLPLFSISSIYNFNITELNSPQSRIALEIHT